MDRAEILKSDKEVIYKKLKYTPSPEQQKIHDDATRNRLVSGGERGGKSKLGAMELTGSIFADAGNLYWLFGATYQETSQEYFYLTDNFNKLGLLASVTKVFNPGEIVLKTGTVIKTISGTDPRAIGREAPDGILVCEAAKIDYITFLRLTARCAEKRAWMLLTGTFEGSLGWYPEKFIEWQLPNVEGRSFSLPSWSNLVVFPGGRKDPEIIRQEKSLPKELFDERFGGVPCPPTGLVFKEFKVTHHVKDISINFNEPIYLAIDPGFAGAYAVEVVQVINDVIYVVDEVYEQHKVHSEVIQICQMRPWWDKVTAGGWGTIDIAGTQHHAQPAAVEVWTKQAGIALNSQKVPIDEGINRLRTFLKINPLTNQPSMVISPKCRGLISEFGGCPNPFTTGSGAGKQMVYQYKMDRENNVMGEDPEDKNNHGIKAMIYFLVGRFGYANRSQNQKTKVKYW